MNIRKVIDYGTMAPSGDNCQPWRFETEGQHVRLFNIPGKDSSLFNFRQRASLVAHGALIENMTIAARALGYDAQVKLFPERSEPDLVATVDLTETDPREEPLFPFIPERCTNRKPYQGGALSEEQRRALLAAPKQVGGELHLMEGQKQLAALCRVAAINDGLVFDNPHVHRFLFEYIRWTKDEAQRTRDGLFIDTLELSAFHSLGFKLLRNWNAVKVLNRLGLPLVVAMEAKKLCRSSGAMGLVTVNGDFDTDYITGGRAVQRVWLEAARLGLSMQPVTGVTFLIQKMKSGDSEGLSPSERSSLEGAHGIIQSFFDIGPKTMVMMFRIGKSGPPSARSLRLPLDRVVAGSAPVKQTG